MSYRIVNDDRYVKKKMAKCFKHAYISQKCLSKNAIMCFLIHCMFIQLKEIVLILYTVF